MRKVQGKQSTEPDAAFAPASGDGLVFQAPLFRVRRGLKTAFVQREARTTQGTDSGTPLARALALGHRIRQAVETGEVADFADAARKMNVSRAWVSMLVELTFLAPNIQDWILHHDYKKPCISASQLLATARHETWTTQMQSGCSRDVLPENQTRD